MIDILLIFTLENHKVLDSDDSKSLESLLSEERLLQPFRVCVRIKPLGQMASLWIFGISIGSLRKERWRDSCGVLWAKLLWKKPKFHFIVLVLTKAGAKELKDFKLISLVGRLYKLLAKVLANKLKKVEGKVVSFTQHAFGEGRQILDMVLIANEVIDLRMKSIKSRVTRKLDIEKAFNHVN